jgi:hypothetical protein
MIVVKYSEKFYGYIKPFVKVLNPYFEYIGNKLVQIVSPLLDIGYSYRVAPLVDLCYLYAKYLYNCMKPYYSILKPYIDWIASPIYSIVESYLPTILGPYYNYFFWICYVR